MDMKHFNLLLALVFFLALAGFITTLFLTKTKIPGVAEIACMAEAKICPDGSAVGRTGPHCAFAPCPEPLVATGTKDETQEQIDAKKDLIVIETPTPHTTITSPITITGKARGSWYFEASFPVVVIDGDGKIIGEGHANAEDNWMTQDFVPFTAIVHFIIATDTPYRRGALILKKDNPSGLPRNDDALEIPVQF